MAEKTTISLGEKIAKLRKERKLSLDKLSAMAKTSKSYLWDLENRKSRNPTVGKLTKIAKALGTTINYLLN